MPRGATHGTGGRDLGLAQGGFRHVLQVAAGKPACTRPVVDVRHSAGFQNIFPPRGAGGQKWSVCEKGGVCRSLEQFLILQVLCTMRSGHHTIPMAKPDGEGFSGGISQWQRPGMKSTRRTREPCDMVDGHFVLIENI